MGTLRCSRNGLGPEYLAPVRVRGHLWQQSLAAPNLKIGVRVPEKESREHWQIIGEEGRIFVVVPSDDIHFDFQSASNATETNMDRE